jgi:anti-anti-sigma regulatory factor
MTTDAVPHIHTEEIVRLRQRVTELEHALAEHADIQEALLRRDAILHAVGFAAGRFLSDASLEENMHDVLLQLGQATSVSRVYIFENFTEPGSDTLFMRQRWEWAAPGIEPQIDNPELQHLSYDELGFARWANVMAQGEALFGDVHTFPPGEREVLEPQQILSLVVVPIFSAQEWWGFIGFDECVIQRTWEAAEVAVLQVAAGIIGAAIHRQFIDAHREQQASQEHVIQMQQALLRELSTPLIPITDRVVIMPLVGTMDSSRVQQMMDTLLQGIEQHHAEIAILDITGVQVVDTQVANMFIRSAQAARLLGARVMLTGISPQVAQTLVQLQIDLSSIDTRSSLQAGIAAVLATS